MKRFLSIQIPQVAKMASSAKKVEMSQEIKKKTQLQIESDIHLEFYKRTIPTITKHAENLALLGDIGKPFESNYKEFIEAQSKQFENVFVLLGNHEYYSITRTVPEILEKAKEVCGSFKNVHLLERDSYQLTEKTRLLGCTLWSQITEYSSGRLNDFNKIHLKLPRMETSLSDPLETYDKREKISVKNYRDWHCRDLFWIEKEISECRKAGMNAVVLTHHAPLKEMSGKYVGSDISSAFTSPLDHLFKPPVIAFANGHVHSNCDILKNNIRCISNARGYPGEDTGYKENVVVDIP